MGALFGDDRGSVKVDLVVDDQQGVVGVDHIVVDTHTIQVLLEQVLKEQVLLLKSGLLLVDGQLVQVDLVKAFVEVVQHLKFVVRVRVKTSDFLDAHVGVFCGIGVRLVERKHFLLFSLKLSAKLSGFQDFLSQVKVGPEGLHAFKTVAGQSAELSFFLLSLAGHLLLQVVVMLHDLGLLHSKLLVSVLALMQVLLGLELPVVVLLFQNIDLLRVIRNLLRSFLG